MPFAIVTTQHAVLRRIRLSGLGWLLPAQRILREAQERFGLVNNLR